MFHRGIEEPEDEAGAGEYVLPEGHDWLLSYLVRWGNLGIGTSLTLSVGGQLISGHLASEKQYIEAVRSTFSANIHGLEQVAAAIDETFVAILDTIVEVPRPNAPQPPPTYIHLKDAKVFGGPTPVPTNQGIWWRGKIASVDGFWVGLLQPQGV